MVIEFKSREIGTYPRSLIPNRMFFLLPNTANICFWENLPWFWDFAFSRGNLGAQAGVWSGLGSLAQWLCLQLLFTLGVPLLLTQNVLTSWTRDGDFWAMENSRKRNLIKVRLRAKIKSGWKRQQSTEVGEWGSRDGPSGFPSPISLPEASGEVLALMHQVSDGRHERLGFILAKNYSLLVLFPKNSSKFNLKNTFHTHYTHPTSTGLTFRSHLEAEHWSMNLGIPRIPNSSEVFRSPFWDPWRSNVLP